MQAHVVSRFASAAMIFARYITQMNIRKKLLLIFFSDRFEWTSTIL